MVEVWKSNGVERKGAFEAFAVLTFASLVMAINYRTFVAWGGLYPAGTTGISMLIQRILQKLSDVGGWGWSVPFSPINLALNAVPVWIGFRYIGRRFTMWSLYVIFMTGLLTDMLPVDMHSLWHGSPACSIGNVAQCDIQLRGENFDPEATVTVGTVTVGRDFSEVVVPVTAKVVHYGQTATSAKVVVTLTPASGGTSLAKEFVIDGDLVSHGFSAVFTGLKAGTKYNVTASVTIGGTVVKSAAGTLTTGYPPPAATVSIGAVTVGRDFAVATVPVAAQVSEYGSATGAKVVVTLTPAGGGSKVTREFALGGDTAVHQFSAAFDGLTAGGRYDVTAKVVVGDSSGWNDDGKFAAADSFAWFDESATSFSAAKWTGAGETVKIQDGALVVSNCKDSKTTFTPEKRTVSFVQVVLRLRESGCYTAETIPKPDGSAAISAIARSADQSELVVWGGGKWNATGLFFVDDAANFDVVVDLDFRNHNVKYSVDGRALGTYSLPNTFGTVSSIAFGGYSVLSELVGAAEDANLVRDGNGNEYATFADAMNAGATGVLSPLWLSTWSLPGFSGVFDVRDPNGLITYAKGTQTVQTENLGGGVVRTWYVQLSDADIRAGANKYLKNTAELGLVKAITDGSAVRIGDYLVVNGTMSFVVEIDDVAVAKEAVKKLVQVKSELTDEWRQPADADIKFENGRVVVTPNKGGASGFARVKVVEDDQ